MRTAQLRKELEALELRQFQMQKRACRDLSDFYAMDAEEREREMAPFYRGIADD